MLLEYIRIIKDLKNYKKVTIKECYKIYIFMKYNY